MYWELIIIVSLLDDLAWCKAKCGVLHKSVLFREMIVNTDILEWYLLIQKCWALFFWEVVFR